MPLVNIKLIEEVYSQDQKQEMIRRMTDIIVDLGGEHMRPVTVVIIEEVKSGDWGVAVWPFLAPTLKRWQGGSRKICFVPTTCPKSREHSGFWKRSLTKGGPG